jgi:hypothetical protein
MDRAFAFDEIGVKGQTVKAEISSCLRAGGG